MIVGLAETRRHLPGIESVPNPQLQSCVKVGVVSARLIALLLFPLQTLKPPKLQIVTQAWLLTSGAPPHSCREWYSKTPGPKE